MISIFKIPSWLLCRKWFFFVWLGGGEWWGESRDTGEYITEIIQVKLEISVSHIKMETTKRSAEIQTVFFPM